MSLTKLERESRKILHRQGQLDGKKPDKIIRLILADNLTSRTEKRFVKTLMSRHECDDEAIYRFKNVLAT